MNYLELRLYFLICTLFCWLNSFAQGEDDDLGGEILKRGHELDDMDLTEGMDYTPVHIRTSDVLFVIILVVSCLVFRRIWKGCSYLIIIVGIIFYYLLH